jgi:hypothetical protein
MGCLNRCAPLAVVLAAAGAHPAFGQDGGAAEQRTVRCIALSNLDRTEVLDDHTIVFRMRNGVLYLNHLARDCPGLEREQRFMYSPTGTQLCAVDGVTVIEKWAFGFTRGFTCSLSEFNPLTKGEYQALLSSVAPRHGEKGVPPAPHAALGKGAAANAAASSRRPAER